MTTLDPASLLPAVIRLAEIAGDDILAIYARGPIAVTHKSDASPVTAADLAAHRRIVAGLRALTPTLPVVSEEGREPPDAAPHSEAFWLVDPLDGTYEFIDRTGEFTVNIALIEGGRPVLGVVNVPVHRVSYWGGVGLGAWRRRAGKTQPQAVRVVAPRPGGQPLRVVASKRYLTEATRALIATLGPHETLQVGSSLKFCRIAEGEADVYPRLGPTSEWDTAAAQAVVEAAGGLVCTLQGEPLHYGKADILNPDFVVSAVPLATLQQRA